MSATIYEITRAYNDALEAMHSIADYDAGISSSEHLAKLQEDKVKALQELKGLVGVPQEIKSVSDLTWLLRDIELLCRDMREIDDKVEAGNKAWAEGTDPYEMAACDPSDVYCLGEERDELYKKMVAVIDQI